MGYPDTEYEYFEQRGGLARPQIMHAGGGVGPPLPPGMPPIGGPGAPLLPQETAKLDNYPGNFGEQEEVRPWTAKGQLISKCPFCVIVSTKIPTIFFDNFCPRI